MSYKSLTLFNHRHLAAQAHPKDFDLRKSIEKNENPNLLLSTYKHLGIDKNQVWLNITFIVKSVKILSSTFN